MQAYVPIHLRNGAKLLAQPTYCIMQADATTSFMMQGDPPTSCGPLNQMRITSWPSHLLLTLSPAADPLNYY